MMPDIICFWVIPGALVGRISSNAVFTAAYLVASTRDVCPGTLTFSTTILPSFVGAVAAEFFFGGETDFLFDLGGVAMDDSDEPELNMGLIWSEGRISKMQVDLLPRTCASDVDAYSAGRTFSLVRTKRRQTTIHWRR